MPDGPRISWKWIGGGVIVVLVLLALLFTAWLHRQTDLDRVEARMRALGIDPSETQRHLMMDVRWKVLITQCPSNSWISKDGTLPVTPGKARPDSKEAEALVEDALSIHAGVMVDSYESAPLRSFLQAQVTLADEESASRAIRALLHLSAATDMRSSNPDIGGREIVKGICARRKFGRRFQDESLVADLRLVADAIDRRLREPWAVELAPLLSHAREGGDSFARYGGILLPSIYNHYLGSLILCRAGRESYFNGYLQWYEQSRLAPDNRALAGLVRKMNSPGKSHFEQQMPAALLDTRPTLVWMARSALTTATHLRLIAADLDGSAWPEDPFARTPAPLHRAERDGVLIGAWSVGIDGIDHAGDRKSDICMSLGPANGSPLMTDPAPPVSTGVK